MPCGAVAGGSWEALDCCVVRTAASTYRRLPRSPARRDPWSPQTSLLGPPPGLLAPPVPAELLPSARHLQVGDKQRVFTGIVTSLHDYFGVVDDEVFFQLSAVKGRMPQLGEKVLVKAAYNPSQAVPWNALKVQTLSNQPLLKAPLLHVASLGQKQGILGAQPQLLFQPPRIPPLFPQKPVNVFPAPPSLPLGHLGRYRGPKGRSDSGRWDDFDSKKRKQKGAEPWAGKKARHELPQYRVHFARYAVDSPFCDAMEILRRYCSIPLPHGFYDVRLCWLAAFPLARPLSLQRRSRIVLAEPRAAPAEAPAPPDARAAFSAKVLLPSWPGLEELYRTCLSYIDDSGEQREAPEHPTKQIKFLLGKKEDEAVLIGGEWSPSLDGPDPEADPMVLVRTAIRCTKAQAGLDLSNCTKWARFAEFRYLRQGEPSQSELAVVFLPDVWACMPSLQQWEACRPQAPASPRDPPAATETEAATEADPEAAVSPEPALVARPRARDACSNISLFALLEYRRRREKLSFEVAVVAELFQEMLQRDFGYKLYKALLALPEKEEAPEGRNPELERAPEPAKEPPAEAAVASEEAEQVGSLRSPRGPAARPLPRLSSCPGPAQPPPKSEPRSTEAERPAGSEAAPAGGEQERSPSECKGDAKDSAGELCVLSLGDGLLLLPEEEEEEFGAKLEDAEVRSTASNQSEMEFSSLQDVPKDLDPSAVLPLDALLAFVYFDSNFCGYLHRRDLEKILLTLGLHLCKEQVRGLVNRVVTQYACQYRSLRYGRHEAAEAGGPEEQQLGNLPLLPPARPPAEVSAAAEQGGLVCHKGTVLNVGRLLEQAEQAESSRLYLEGRIHALEAKLEESESRLSGAESSGTALAAELRELQRRLAEAEEQARAAERQKCHLQRLLQEHRTRLAPVQLEIQSLLEKTDNCLDQDVASSK
ncbi:cell cycle and apoptosis regulator protein 2 [Nothoprocta perdicaria]|uniref:cell cycle and apoptosis regulator protein 2 n=1 Tax=Nothoprocta perdicaria TaxID=30464 RepID=UPI000E1C3257|nr:cell cycle and apoptosis regulator protein 2 [Nothoprocta perdicaria]